VQAVPDEYRDQLPLTLRQIFYRLGLTDSARSKARRAVDAKGDAGDAK
jgi:hypothetical protein